MSSTQLQHETLIWTDAAHAELVTRIVSSIDGLNILAIGGPKKGDLTNLAEQFNAPAEDDLRKMLVDQPGSSLLLATMTGVRTEDLKQAAEQGTDVLSLEPPATKPEQVLAYEKGQAPLGRLMLAPLMRLSPAWISAADPQQVLNPIQCLSICSLCPTDTGSLYARLYDAIDMVISLLGAPDRVDATLTGSQVEVPDELQDLTGQMTCHLHFPSNASATLLACDCAAYWSRQLVIVGEHGQLQLDDRGYQLNAESSDETDATGTSAAPNDPVELIARQWNWMIKHQTGPDATDDKAVLATCRTALLSARTGQGESTEMFLRM